MTTIKIKKGAGTPSGLTFGELAYDVTNKKLFIGITGGNALLANTDGGVASFNGITGAVTGVTLGGTNIFTALNTFNAGISAAGGVTFANAISVDLIKIGRGAGGNTYNVAIGNGYDGPNLQFNTTGEQNTAIGYDVLAYNTTGNYNVGVGTSALEGNNSGSSNTAVGNSALIVGNGSQNTAVGVGALTYNNDGQNTAIGYLAGSIRGTGSSARTSGTGGIFIGYQARASGQARTNEIVIGTNALGLGSNTAVIGATAQTAATIYGLMNLPGGLSAAGITVGGSISLQNQEFIRNTTDGRMDFMPAPAGSTHFGMYMDFTSWSYGVKLGTIRASDSALNAGPFLWEAQLSINSGVGFNLGSDGQYSLIRATTGNDTGQLSVNCTSGTNSGAWAIVAADGREAANRSPTTVHTNPNLYIYRAGSASANDFLRMEHDGTNANIVTGGVSGIDMEPGSGFVGFSGGISASGGITFSSTMRVAGVATFAGLINSTAGLSGTGITLSGNLSAATKSFVIPHPTKPHMTLQHGSLEGPENGVYVRGRLTGTDTIPLPDYWHGLVDSSTITAYLTEIGNRNHHWISSVEGYTVTVNSDSGAIDCFYTVWGERKDVGKMPVEY